MAFDPMTVKVPQIEKLLELDPYLKTHEKEIRRRYVNIRGSYRTHKKCASMHAQDVVSKGYDASDLAGINPCLHFTCTPCVLSQSAAVNLVAIPLYILGIKVRG